MKQIFDEILIYCLIAMGLCAVAMKTTYAVTIPHKQLLKVAVIDTGLDLGDARFKDVLCKTGHRDYTGYGIKDTVGHGTHIAGLIKQYAGNAGYCLIIYKWYDKNLRGSTLFNNELQAMFQAVSDGATIINFSGGGNSSPNNMESVVAGMAPQVTFVVAAGNEHRDAVTYYPAHWALDNDNIVVVGGLDVNGKISLTSNYGSIVKVWEQGEQVYSTFPGNDYGYLKGTSPATAIHTGKLIKQRLYK